MLKVSTPVLNQIGEEQPVLGLSTPVLIPCSLSTPVLDEQHARAHHGEANFKFHVARPVFPMSPAVLGKEHGRAPFQHARADLSS